MKILHTSDWHLGRSLYGRKRYEEFSKFLDWLAKTIEREGIDALLVAGDIFDTSTPSNRAQTLYYRFLCRVSTSCCRHIVVIAGNHDSPSFLNAPKELLRALNVYVVGAMTQSLEDEVIVLHNGKLPEAIVCAVPYLRDKDIRTVAPGESIDDKNAKLIKGLKNHYAEVCAIAEHKQSEFKKAGHDGIPIIAMGHLFTAGGKTVDGDGVRELYVGSLAHVGEDVFPSSIDYLGLGHLHVPQSVGSTEHIRYSGSPIPMGYGEATQNKKIIFVEFNNTTPDIQEIQVPCFQALVRIVGSIDDIHEKLEQLKDSHSRAWLEIEYTGRDIIGNLREILDEALADSDMEICRIKNKRVLDRVMGTIKDNETLDDLDNSDVFTRCLETFHVPKEDREELTASYNEIIQSLHEEDVNAE
ncbi:MAG: exonuclease SbcCD subunit D C-terminal domain-containing protein [Desulfobacterium sp.]